ncbi:MAG: Uma2 family endonuclease [Chloroflexota bacterium]|nr:Uma2 family endonuclease [Chloroflexota bacterium]
MAVALRRRTFTADEFERMAEAGILGEDERVELIEGEIVWMSPIGPNHSWCVKRLNALFARLGDRVIPSIQDPIRLHDRLEPQPDVVLVRPDAPRDRHPTPADILLVIEVASSSISVDRDVKGPMYARAGIADYWIFDLDAYCLLVLREPSADGYRVVRVFARGQQVAPLFAPDFPVDVAEILGTPDGD